jgi:hypothetical protein
LPSARLALTVEGDGRNHISGDSMAFSFRNPLVLAGTLLATALIVVVPSQSARADAESGTCARGWRLEEYSYSLPAYNHAGDLMWKIRWRKRWCYNVNRRAVGSVYAPRPSVTIYSYFGLAWNYEGIVDRDAHYTDVDARGGRHPNYPRWGHLSWHKVKMDHCALKWAACTSHHYKVGIISYWDGSKKLILP